MEGRMAVKAGPWTTVAENVIHPDHDGVVGDLIRNRETGHYLLLEYDGLHDRYDRYSVPYHWARKQDPTLADAHEPQRQTRRVLDGEHIPFGGPE